MLSLKEMMTLMGIVTADQSLPMDKPSEAVDAENTIHKIWINNNLVSTNTGRYPPNFTYGLNNSGDEMVIGDGSWDSYGSPNFNGYMAEINYLDGQYLEPDYETLFQCYNQFYVPFKSPVVPLIDHSLPPLLI